MADENTLKDWQVPPSASSPDRKLGWLREVQSDGEAWQRSQRGFADWNKALDVLSGIINSEQVALYRSQLSSNRLKRNIKEIIGALCNIKPISGYQSEVFTEHANMLNKVARAIYLEQFFDLSFKEALQWAALTGTGWIRPVYRRNQAGKGKGNIQLMTYGAPCVLPFQLPSNNDWQEAYAVTLLDEMPIYMAHSMFPDYQDKLNPTQSKYWYAQEIRQSAQQNTGMFSKIFRRRSKDSPMSDQYIPVRYTTVIDLTINTTGQMIPMGQIGSPWAYEVPTLGGDIAAGHDSNGTAIFRKANENDARLYPYRRQMISSENCVMYDGPAFNWHGELDLIPITIDDSPWEPLGFSLVHDGYELQEAINKIDRGCMDKILAQMDMPLGYDMNAVSKNEADQFDPMQPRARIAYDGSQVDKPFAPPVPPEVYLIRPEVMAFKKDLGDMMDYQHGLRDITALAKSRAIGKGADQLEALMEANGPIVRMISRTMERSVVRVGVQLKYLILQYETANKVLQYVREDEVTPEIFDYDPNSLIPSHLPGERTTDEQQRGIASLYTKIQRARWFAEAVKYVMTPHSLHEILQMTYRLSLLQMRQRQIPIDSRTIAESWNLANFGNKPNGSTIYDRYWQEKEDEVLHMLRIKKIAESEGLDPGAMGGPTAGGSTHGKGGRPPSGGAAPSLATKDGGTRTVIKESK